MDTVEEESKRYLLGVMMISTDSYAADTQHNTEQLNVEHAHWPNLGIHLNGKRFFTLIDWIAEHTGRNVPAIVNLEELRSLPANSFGRAWVDSLDQQGLVALTTGPRRKQLHDGIHVLTGYGTDPLGEAEVQAFLLGAKFHVAHVMIGLALLPIVQARALLQGRSSSRSSLTASIIGDRLWMAYQRGAQSTFDPDTWQPEHFWELPLESVQTRLKL